MTRFSKNNQHHPNQTNNLIKEPQDSMGNNGESFLSPETRERSSQPRTAVVEIPVPDPIHDPANTVVDSSDDTQETSADKSSSGEELSSESSDVDRFQKKVFEIAKLVVPGTAEVLDQVIKEVKAERVNTSSATPSQQVKNRSSGKGSSSQRKKKR